jgi:hypothetical protein
MCYFICAGVKQMAWEEGRERSMKTKHWHSHKQGAKGRPSFTKGGKHAGKGRPAGGKGHNWGKKGQQRKGDSGQKKRNSWNKGGGRNFHKKK